jgi:hypothetical protein
MSEHNHGAYAPPTADAPLSFDARQPVRGSRPFPITLILSGLVLLALIAVIFVFYRSGVRAAGQAPQAVGAPVGELKTAPPADAQPQDPAAGLQIYHAETGQPAGSGAAQPQFTAPPEQPAPRPIAAPPAPAPITVAPAPAAVAPPAAPAQAPKPVAALPALRAAPEAPVAAAPQPKPVQPRPAPHQKPVAVAAKPVEPAAKAASGHAMVQIGAVSSTALAETAWREAVSVAPGMAAGKGKGVEKIEKDGKVLYRTTVTGFASKADAAAFCGRLKAAGKSCFVK